MRGQSSPNFLSLATIAIFAATATPLSAATSGHSIPWASLGVVRPSLLQPSGWGSPIAAEPKNTNIAWCAQKGVEIASGSGKATFVPDSSVEQMLKASHLGVQDSPGKRRSP